MNTETNDPLQGLVSGDTKAIDRQALANVLGPYVRIDQKTKEFSFLPAFAKLGSNDEKVEIVLTAAKARALIFDSPDGMEPKGIAALQIMPLGSVKSAIKSLYDKHKIQKDKDSRYSMPTYRIHELTEKYVNAPSKQGQ